jgi:alpha-galactosidase
MMVGWFEDWRKGLEEYGKANRLAEPHYLFEWNKATPFGWNSWGAIQDKLSLSKAKAVVDFFADSCKGFRNADSALYIDLDSYWDNMRTGGSAGDYSQLISFCDYCKKRGFIPGVYWAPFTDWGKNAGRSVEGSEYKYAECWLKANGQYNDLDGARAMDPTHPATKTRIAWLVKRLKECGFQMIKIDFLGHGTLEADRFYDSTVHTGMQAFRKGMEYLIDQLGGKMLVYAAISPNLATGRYTHMRRIACDSYKSINESAYTLNSTQYGWWLNQLYDYLDADHVVFEKESPGANRARLASALITGTLITGDDYSANGKWRATAQNLLQNKDLLRVAGKGKSFRPVEGNTGNQAGELFIRITKDQACLAIINYGKDPKKYSIDLDRAGLDGSRNYTGIKELFTEKKLSAQGKLEVEIAGEDAALYIFR